MNHDLKIDEPYYKAVVEKRKTFEIRYNDRGYNAGDTVIMKVEGRSYRDFPPIKAKIGYVTSFNQKENWVVFSLLQVRTIE